MTLARTVRQGKVASCWKTKPTLSPTPRTGSPTTSTSPSEGSSNPLTSVNVVDLPQPVGPTTATNSPRPTVRSSPLTAVCRPPDGVRNVLLAPRSSMAGLVSALMAGDGRCGLRHGISLLGTCRSFACNGLLCSFCARYNSEAETRA